MDARERIKGQTALMWAVSEQHVDVARTLVERGADVTARSDSGFTPLMFAARSGDLELTRLLLDSDADVNTSAADGSTALLVATVRGHLALAEFLLEQGADPNADGAGYTPLHWASSTWESIMTHDYHVESGETAWRSGCWSPRYGFTLFKGVLARNGQTPLSVAEGVVVDMQVYTQLETAALLRRMGGISEIPEDLSRPGKAPGSYEREEIRSADGEGSQDRD